jgi:ADP-ribose pyrophosphatase YjhB (NUDIX family)
MSERIVRCQAAVLKEDRILLIEHNNCHTGNIYWWLPGGGLEPGESREDCVQREIREETHLQVVIERLLFETEDIECKHTYRWYATYLCRPMAGEASPGDEGGQAGGRSISTVGWYPLWDEHNWEPGFFEPHLYPLLVAIRESLEGRQP